MNLFKTTFYTGIATLVKMISSLIINKVVALIIGPSGIAMIGNFQNFLNISTTIGNAGITSGITKYVAEFNEDTHKRNSYIHAALFVTFICTFGLSLLIILFSGVLSNLIFNSNDFKDVFFLVGLTLIFNSVNTVIIALVNGLKQIKLLVSLNIIGSICSLITSVGMTMLLGLKGALYAISLLQLFTFIIYFFILKKKKLLYLFRLEVIKEKIIYTNLFKYTIMAMTTIIAVPLTQMIIRKIIVVNTSLTQAGYWDGMNRISSMSLMVITTALSAYYLPKLSETHSFKEFNKELIGGYKLILPAMLAIFTVMYIFRDLIIYILYSKDFYEMRDLFLYQFVGDFFKMCSWLVGYVLVAKGMTKEFVFSELFAGGIYIVFAMILVPIMGVKGAVISYDIMYLGYLVLMLLLYATIFKRYFREG